MKAKKITAELVKTRMVQDFILAEFVKGVINTQDDVKKYTQLIMKKLGVDNNKACEIFRSAIR
ncbi:hypothetical protein [Segatella oulorum]|jgi:hypothetical protein|uniref:hypothetical protein n=1 Tax=Segatella oulorum TaxID=28136 RepID=UPI0028EFE361|nr:hypothetical protein [Segatella oulorum]